ncbi:armadillo repeat-containing protein 2-like [Styela clava]
MNHQNRSPHMRQKASSSNDRPLSLSPKVRSSDVIKEAKQWTALASVKTRRPSTPKDYTRKLFEIGRESGSRPPSAISISSHHFDPSDPGSRPASAASVKLAPLTKAPTVPANAEPVISKVHIPMPPRSVHRQDWSVRSQSRNLFPSPKQQSVGNLPMKAFHPDQKDIGNSGAMGSPTTAVRNVHSAGEGTINLAEPIVQSKPSPPTYKGKSRVKPHSASAININLSELYRNVDNPVVSHPRNSASSSSSAGSVEQQNIPRKKRSGGGSGTNTGEETPDQAKYWNQNVLPLLEALEDPSLSKEAAYEVCVKLHCALNKGNCLNSILGRRRTSLLSTLFKQLNSVSTPVHLACARIILDLQVRRQNLNSVCKMLFKISREKRFDDAFIENNLPDGMLKLIVNFVDPLDNYETLVYLTGAIKFLSDNKAVAIELANKDCVTSFISLLSNTMLSLHERNNQKKEKLRATDILIQATAVLRSMADVEKHAFSNSGLFTHLFAALKVLGSDETLTLNISRLLSKLTMYSELHGEVFSSPDWATSILHALEMHEKCSNIVVRLCFALGNITAKEDHARMLIFATGLNKETTSQSGFKYLSVLNSVLLHFLSSFLTSKDDNSDSNDKEVGDKCLDTVNKIVRVIANLSISEEIGQNIAFDAQSVEVILSILQQVQIDDSEELIINTLTTLNNLSFYSYDDNAVFESRFLIVNILTNILLSDNMACVMEATRVFGNVSQHADVRQLLHNRQVDLMMVAFLDSSTWQMVYSACGVLINMTANKAYRACVIEEGIISKLCDVLKDFAPMEWRVGGVACQLLWNLCESIQSSTTSVLSSKDADSLMEILHAYLQENAPFTLLDSTGWEEDIKQYVLNNWKTDFCPVATRLYKKISSHFSQLVPLAQDDSSQ